MTAGTVLESSPGPLTWHKMLFCPEWPLFVVRDRGGKLLGGRERLKNEQPWDHFLCQEVALGEDGDSGGAYRPPGSPLLGWLRASVLGSDELGCLMLTGVCQRSWFSPGVLEAQSLGAAPGSLGRGMGPVPSSWPGSTRAKLSSGAAEESQGGDKALAGGSRPVPGTGSRSPHSSRRELPLQSHLALGRTVRQGHLLPHSLGSLPGRGLELCSLAQLVLPSAVTTGVGLGLQLAVVQRAGEQRGPWQQWPKVLAPPRDWIPQGLQPPAAVTGVGWAVVSLQAQVMWGGHLGCHTDPGLGRARGLPPPQLRDRKRCGPGGSGRQEGRASPTVSGYRARGGFPRQRPSSGCDPFAWSPSFLPAPPSRPGPRGTNKALASELPRRPALTGRLFQVRKRRPARGNLAGPRPRARPYACACVAASFAVTTNNDRGGPLHTRVPARTHALPVGDAGGIASLARPRDANAWLQRLRPWCPPAGGAPAPASTGSPPCRGRAPAASRDTRPGRRPSPLACVLVRAPCVRARGGPESGAGTLRRRWLGGSPAAPPRR